MSQHKDVRGAGERVESLLGALRAASDPRIADTADELVRTIVDLYGEGLAHVMHVAAGNEEILAQLVADPLVESLLLVHDLHPVDVDKRIQRALDDVRPYLGSHAGGVEYLGVDDDGVARLKLSGSCHGCPSSTVTVRLAIERAIEDAAPEVTRVEVEGVVAEPAGPPLLQIGRRVPAPATPPVSEPVSPVDADGWAHLPPWPSGGEDRRAVNLAGVPVLLCRVDGAMYAYRDGCAECAAPLSAGRLTGDAIGCPDCGRRYSLKLAGAGIDDSRWHLEPLPLLHDETGVRIAVAAAGVVR